MSGATLDLDLPLLATSVLEARRRVEGFAREHDICPGALEAVRLAVSEACTNVIVHAYEGVAAGPLRLCAEIDDRRLRIAVCDEGRGMRPRVDSPGMGLGLPLIATLTDDLQIVEGDTGSTTVRMCFPLDAPPAALAGAA
jgi:serine/threonine-protein kinase RsbW/stage II sporulation protein AB (anti-sigma F factor)